MFRDVQSCLLVLKLSVQRREWWFSLVLRSAQVRGASRLRSGSPRCLYSDLSCHIKDYQNGMYYLNFLKRNLYSFGTHVYRTERPVPKRFGMNTCTVTPLFDRNLSFESQVSNNCKIAFSHLKNTSKLQPIVTFCKGIQEWGDEDCNKQKVLLGRWR